jgi:hypothetical protein
LGVFAAAVPVDGSERKPIADYAGDQHNDFLAFVYADDGEQVRDAEEGKGDADKEGPEPFHFGVGGDAQAQDYDAEDEVGEDYRVYIHFLSPYSPKKSSIFQGTQIFIYHTPCVPLSLRGVKGEGEGFFIKEGLRPS